ncbi:MAG: hypothetical protein J5857_03150 [Treponema sp.]|nr:hypothetical protein [Treponema sp.]
MDKIFKEEVRKWQTVELDESDMKTLQDLLLYAEVKKFVAFLGQNKIDVSKALVDNYANMRGFI